ncbi:transposase [Saccharothrix isguenensis]
MVHRVHRTLHRTGVHRLPRPHGAPGRPEDPRHVIAGWHPVHRSKAVSAWLQDNADRIELHLMPCYSREFNPDTSLDLHG